MVYGDTRAQGLALKKLGINLDLAPVVDVRVAADSAIGRRSFGSDPALDATLATAAIQGYQAAGIGATAKHFLGLGEVKLNADVAFPVVRATRAQLEARDMPPMRAAIKAGVAALMVTRVAIPSLDSSGTAAYASRLMVQGVIRGELGYKGLVITDSLLSPAVLGGPGPVIAAIAALRAGDDMLLLGGGARVYEPIIGKVIAAVERAVQLSVISEDRLDDAVRHILWLKARLGLLPPC
jgi:beta-N-acetylhexosaminidase